MRVQAPEPSSRVPTSFAERRRSIEYELCGRRPGTRATCLSHHLRARQRASRRPLFSSKTFLFWRSSSPCTQALTMITHESACATFLHAATAARTPFRTPQLASRRPGSVAVEPRSHPHPKPTCTQALTCLYAHISSARARAHATVREKSASCTR